MFCTYCGAQMNEGAKFCPKCGTATGSGEVANQQEQQVQQGTLQQPVQPQVQTGEYSELTGVQHQIQQPAQGTKNYTAPTPFQPYSSIDPNQGMVNKTAFKGKQVSVGSSGHMSFGKKNNGTAQNTAGGGTGSASGLATTGGRKKRVACHGF